MEKRAINILMLSVLMSLAVLLMPVRVSAETETDTAPTVMYKLINHDCIKLKWDEVTGADGYYIYRTDTGTGKTVKYKSIVKGTDVTIKNLSAETEYIFYVEPINGKNGKTTVGQRSAGTRVTTPKEWYYYDDSKVDPENKIIESSFYRTDYAKTKKEKIYLGDIKAVDEIIYYDGWYYVIGYCDGIESKPFPWGEENNQMCVARIREDGTQKEILFDDFYKAHDTNYYYYITEDVIYLRQRCRYSERKEEFIRYYYDEELCWLISISLKTGKVKTIASPCLFSWLDSTNNYIYYGYDDIYTYSQKNDYLPGTKGIYKTVWYDWKTYLDFIDPEKLDAFCYRITKNSNQKQQIYNYRFDERICNAKTDDEIIALEGYTTIYSLSLNNPKPQKIYHGNLNVDLDNITNQYIYFSEYDDPMDYKTYCRIKNDGTGLEKQNTPFEWYY